ncbi:DNA/RNA non-specific endonuclease [Brevundimonas sp. BAL450]|uniref:DNA/RNA non-specific endonuclease n=1 Tax=Brevundimonas sp. BAL450 TaxID=1708162 RepID=UPI0018CBA4B3|nr:DNA/RNA non-specific endonuclease [Brevundimonas sp. BAL450]MBG7614634.1 DNA/RNA non-specific endonuclease [Brevundimonas sp. BAL450]
MRARLAIVCLLLAATSAFAQDGAELHTFHCLHGCPSGASATNDVIVREIYTLSSNDRRKFADWVAYRITSDTVGPSGARRWQADPWLSDEETLEPDDYEGAPRALQIDRGHQAPLAAFSGTPFAEDTNILTNITPQRSALNQASWQHLEARERSFVERTDSSGPRRALYVLTGPLYERMMPPLPMPHGYERHRVPSAYWKVIATTDGQIAAFIFDQETPRYADYCDMRVSLEEVEIRADLTLFPRLRTRAFSDLAPALGCGPA